MSGKCSGITSPTSQDNCTNGDSVDCIYDSNTSKCKCKDDTFVDTAAGCKLKLAKCGDRCSTTGACDASQCTVPGGDQNCVPDS